MVRFAAVALMVCSFAFTAFCQEPAAAPAPAPKPIPAPPMLQVFGGFTIFHADTAGLNGPTVGYALDEPPSVFGVRTFFYGWEGQAQYNFTRWVGVAVDFGGRSGSPFLSRENGVTGLPNQTSYSLLAGPVISYRTHSIFTPYFHVLVGWERTSLSASTISGPLTPITSVATTYNDVVLAPGGGLDVKVNHRFSVRPAQVDWYHTSINQNLFYGSAYGAERFRGLGNAEKNIRISTGVVVKF